MKKKDIEELVSAYEKKIRQFFLKRIFNQTDVDDLVQETICQIITSIRSFSGRSHVSTWIYAICKNVLFSYVYQKEKQKKIIKRINELKQFSFHDYETKIELKFLIESLSDTDKLLFELFYIKNHSVAEISGLLRKPAGTVKFYLYQLRNEIKKRFKE